MKPFERKAERYLAFGWGIALFALCFYALRKIGGFDLTVTLDSGRVVPNVYATVDHPFHAARAAAVLDALRQGELLRWMGSHQGGYPVEFYPLGVAWLDVGAWSLLFGQFSILAVHKLVVGLIFVLPALAYWLLVRGDRIHPSAAFLAMSIHIAVPGYWLSGGYEELVGWGLVTNVTGATFGVLATVLLGRYVLYRYHWSGVGAVVAIACAAVSNPRSLFGIVIATIAIGGWYLLIESEVPLRARLRDAAVSIGAVGGLAFLIAAPVVTSLMRYSDQYFFLHYQFYEPLETYWDALVLAITERVLLVSIGSGLALLLLYRCRRLRVSQAVALTVGIYTLFTMWVATTSNPPPLVEQLEAPRLMPFQRQLMIVLAAIGVVYVVQRLTQRLPFVWRELIITVLVLGVSIGGIRTAVSLDREIPVNEIAMYEVETVGDQRFADLEDAIRAANDARPDGSTVFVIGNQQKWWHEQLWAPGIVYGTYQYDDWLWYWHADQSGPYDATQGYYVPNPSDAFTSEYFQRHGIGVVMVSDMWVPSGTPPRQAAAESDLLRYVGGFGSWDVYTVIEPGYVVSRGDNAPASVSVTNQRIEATWDEGRGEVVIRQNWFPRWQAEVNGERVPIERTEDGYMRITVPDGPATLSLTYAVTGLDWIARAASVMGLAGTLVFAFAGRRIRSTVNEESTGATVPVR